MTTPKKTTPFPGDVDGQTRRLLSYKQLGEKLFLSRTQTFRLEREGARLLPDGIVVPGTKGWDEERVLQYGIDTGRLDENGQPAGGWDEGRPRNRVQDGSLPTMRRLVEDKYSAAPRVYLGSALCSYVYGHTDLSVLFLRKRGGFFAAQVLIGGKLLGWDEAEVIKFGRQTGRLADPATLRAWALRRTEEFGMDPRVPWVVELLGRDKLPTWTPPQWMEEVGNTPDA
jgi:predicted DNA-binding transcriptional regulator AlpA